MPLIRDAQEMGEHIRESRIRLGYTQADLAYHAEVGIRFVSELERGKETVQLAQTLRVLQAAKIVIKAVPLREKPVEPVEPTPIADRLGLKSF